MDSNGQFGTFLASKPCQDAGYVISTHAEDRERDVPLRAPL